MPEAYFMKVDKISGPIGIPPYTGWFELVDYRPAAESPTMGSFSQGSSSAYNSEGHTATVLKKVDRGSPLITQQCSSGERTEIIIAMVYSEDGIYREKWRATYKDALISSYKAANAANGTIPLESLVLEAHEMIMESAEGSKIPPTVRSDQNRPVSLADWFTKVMPFPSSSRK